MGEVYVSAGELAVILRKPVGTLRNWRYRGYGPPWFKVGGTVLYDHTEVQEWIEAQKAAARQANPTQGDSA